MDLENAWATIEPGVDRILNRWDQGVDPQSYMTWYTMTYNYCTNTGGQSMASSGAAKGANLIGGDLYHKLRVYLEKHLDQTTQQGSSLMDDSLLSYYTKHWFRFTTSATSLNHVFAYLNRHWIRREIDEGHKSIYEIYILSLVIWRERLFTQLQEKTINACLRLVVKQRNGESIDTSLIKNVVSSTVALGMDENDSKKSTLDVYKKYFEEPFLAATAAYYKSESEIFIAENPITEYMKKAVTRLAEEETRVETYLHPCTHKGLISTCEQAMIKDHMSLLQDEFLGLLERDRIDDLARMYSLLIRAPEGLDKLRNLFEEHVKKQGLLAIEKVAESANAPATSGTATPQNEQNEDDEEGEKTSKKKPAKKDKGDLDPKLYVDALLSVHKKFESLANAAFQGEAGFVASLDKACREFVNRNVVCPPGSSKSPELLAKYCDSLLRKGSKVAEDGEVESYLTSVMTVFKYVEDKDVFQKFYSKNLAKRLVNSMSASDDSEATMISKLRDACGYEYTNKLQRMFTDMGLSKDLNDSYRDSVARNHDDGLDFYLLVLGQSSWPLTAPSTGFNLPKELLSPYERFTRFFQNKHSGRKLIWLFQLGKGEIKANLPKAPKMGFTFQVSAYQMGILLQYNTSTSYTWEELLSCTGMSPEALAGQLGILVRAKLLLVSDNNGEASSASVGTPKTRYDLNEDFKSKKVKMNLNVGVKSEAKAESEETHRVIEEDRKLLIQAAIVRIMKTRKALKHTALIEEVIHQLNTRFKPRIPDIKKCIDILLEKEYIERMDGQKDTYSYVA